MLIKVILTIYSLCFTIYIYGFLNTQNQIYKISLNAFFSVIYAKLQSFNGIHGERRKLVPYVMTCCDLAYIFHYFGQHFRKFLIRLLTLIWFYPSVCFMVTCQTTFLWKVFSTKDTPKWFISSRIYQLALTLNLMEKPYYIWNIYMVSFLCVASYENLDYYFLQKFCHTHYIDSVSLQCDFYYGKLNFICN